MLWHRKIDQIERLHSRFPPAFSPATSPSHLCFSWFFFATNYGLDATRCFPLGISRRRWLRAIWLQLPHDNTPAPASAPVFPLSPAGAFPCIFPDLRAGSFHMLLRDFRGSFIYYDYLFCFYLVWCWCLCLCLCHRCWQFISFGK